MERQIIAKVQTKPSRNYHLQRQTVGAPIVRHSLMDLQQSIGNQAVQRLIRSRYIQAKLQVNEPGDAFEQEADQVAGKVMRMPDPQADPGATVSNRTQMSRIQRKCTECEEEVQRQPLEEKEEEETIQSKTNAVQTPVIQRLCSDCSNKLHKMPIEEEKQIEKPSMEEEEEGVVQRRTEGDADVQTSDGLQSQIDSLRGEGQPLPETVRAYFEPRFGQDFGGVRLHTGAEGARAARSVNARAFTTGKDIAFGTGQYSPETSSGKRLLAHELTHVVQQGAASHIDSGAKHSPTGLMKQSSSASEHSGQMVQRAPIEILPADFVGPPNTGQRRAAASCDIDCDGTSLGTLHAMPTFFHASRGAPLAGSAGADGIGTALHFVRVATVLPKNNGCLPCTDFKIIQVLNTNEHSADSRGKDSYVDNASSATPFYGDVYLTGVGLHPIPTGYPDAGSDVETTHSIYDRPFRNAGKLGNVTGKNFFWNAEACVTCIKPGPVGKDKVLGCATYGFKRDWDAAKKSHGPVQTVGPGCLKKPSSHFVSTLTSDSSTSSYKFET